MNIELILSPTLYASRQLNAGNVTVAVDVLRATTAICAAFMAGASSVVPLDSTDPLPGYHSQGYIIAAERNGLKLPLATCGNSPTEYLTMNLQGKNLAYSTTNGTVAITMAVQSSQLFVGAFANISVLADALRHQASNDDVVLLCSGWRGDPSIEDTLFCGALIDRLLSEGVSLFNDSASMAVDLWRNVSSNLFDYCQKATHVQRLIRLGAERDVRFSLQLDTCPVVPRYDISTMSLHC